MYTAGAPSGDVHVPLDTDRIVGGSKLHGETRDHIRRKHYSIRTEQAYLDWASNQYQAIYLSPRTRIPQRVEAVGLAISVSGPIHGARPAPGKDAASHLGESAVRRAEKKAIVAAGTHKHSSCHILRLC
jgi:hypothetical protein